MQTATILISNYSLMSELQISKIQVIHNWLWSANGKLAVGYNIQCSVDLGQQDGMEQKFVMPHVFFWATLESVRLLILPKPSVNIPDINMLIMMMSPQLT